MNPDTSWRRYQQAFTSLSGDISGAFGDLGTLLPFVISAISLGVLAPTPVFFGFAAGYLLVAVVYRLPIAVQPMKALGAIILTGGLTSLETAWAGTIIGAVLLTMSFTPHLVRLARALPQSVVTGLQAGLGLMLGVLAVDMMGAGWLIALLALALLALSWIWPRGPWALLVVGGALLSDSTATLPLAAGSSPESLALSMPAVAEGLMAQLPLTLLNAVVVATAVAHSLFPDSARRVSERRLAATSGLLNLALVPFGAMPMCHGAGGIAAHYRFGARSLIAPLTVAAACVLAALQGPTVIAWLAAIPTPVIGALLANAAIELMLGKRLFDARPDCRPVIAATALGTLFGGALVGLAMGLVSDRLRLHVKHRRAARAPQDGGDS
ncbi:putative sulfate/molybdate transporter [Halomonas sp. 11-S5]|uniref:putative sulfate/molybdate transporter n=1 Tax=Halomonas sp. 11-S5 TaxID=2994064 RepID=UPI0024690035|nr:putative sulfate/molybdate transporter [Halomonas sp. 11-S5]